MPNRCAWSWLVSGLLIASTATGRPAAQSVSSEALSKVLNAYQNISHLEVDFQQTKKLKDIDLKLESSGILKVDPPHGVLWRVIKPNPVMVTLSQQTIVIQTASGTQTFSQSENPSEKDRKSFSNMLGWLKLDAEAISNQYEVTQPGPSQYRFVAKDKKATSLQNLEMQMTPEGHIRVLKIEEESGDSIEIRFGKPKIHRRKVG